MTTYAATKAFVLSFSEALWEENRPYGIKVMALCPGVTDTNFFEASHMQRPPARTSQTVDEVVDTALRALKRGKSSVVSGWLNFLMVEAERVVPRSLVLRVAGAVLRNHNEIAHCVIQVQPGLQPEEDEPHHQRHHDVHHALLRRVHAPERLGDVDRGYAEGRKNITRHLPQRQYRPQNNRNDRYDDCKRPAQGK